MTMFDQLFRSQTGLALFSDARMLQSMLDFEAALARAEGRLDIVPAHVVDTIVSCCRTELFDFAALGAEVANAGNAAIPMVKQLTRLVRAESTEAAAYVHWGATSQDAIDCGLVLQVRDELMALDELLEQAGELLAALTETHRATLMAGRTWMQHAVPITFGLKTAGWLDAVVRHRERLVEMRRRVLVVQFGGAAGTLGSLGSKGLAVAKGLGEELGLEEPMVPWHSQRDRIAEIATFHGLVMATLGKIARDLSLLMQTEVGELAEAAAVGRGGSSTMPHKRNPVRTAAILSSALRVPGLVATVLSASLQENERGLGGWHAEWETLPEICSLTLGALRNFNLLLEGLQVFPVAMQRNLEATHGLMMAEAVSMRMAESVGKETAHRVLEEVARRSVDEVIPLRAALAQNRVVTAHLDPATLDALLQPSNYLGGTQEFIDRVLAANKVREKAGG